MRTFCWYCKVPSSGFQPCKIFSSEDLPVPLHNQTNTLVIFKSEIRGPSATMPKASWALRRVMECHK
jgi:hypothetical protein